MKLLYKLRGLLSSPNEASAQSEVDDHEGVLYPMDEFSAVDNYHGLDINLNLDTDTD